MRPSQFLTLCSYFSVKAVFDSPAFPHAHANILPHSHSNHLLSSYQRIWSGLSHAFVWEDIAHGLSVAKTSSTALVSLQYLEEDPRINRIDDSLQLFTQICSNKLLKSTHLVLMLNKVLCMFFRTSRPHTYDRDLSSAPSLPRCLFYFCGSRLLDGYVIHRGLRIVVNSHPHLSLSYLGDHQTDLLRQKLTAAIKVKK